MGEGMRKTIAFLALLAAVSALAQPASALGLEYYGIKTVLEDSSTHNTVSLRFDSVISQLNYGLDFHVSNLTHESNFISDCRALNSGSGSNIVCDFIGMTEENRFITLEFDADGNIRREGDEYQFIRNYGVPVPVDRSFVSITLPRNAILAGENINQSIFPAGGKTSSDGKRIIVYWEMNNVTSGNDLGFSVKYTIADRDYYNMIVLAMALVIVVVMFGVIAYAKRSPQPVPKEKEGPVTSVLTSNEKAIVDVLQRHGGKAIQKVLVRETDFSKAKVSRLVKNLVQRGVVETEPIGRTTKVTLKMFNDEQSAAAEPQDNGSK